MAQMELCCEVLRVRLVDIDCLRKRFTVAEHCEDCGRDSRYCDGGLYGAEVYSARDICGILDDTSVVEAIPIEWLNQKYAENDPNTHEEDYDYYLWSAIDYILTLWREEQESETGE